MLRFILLPACCLLVPTLTFSQEVRSIEPDDATGTSRAVVVASKVLVHTGQVLPLDGRGQPDGKSPGEQIEVVLNHLAAVLADAGSGLERVVKLNIYLASNDLVPELNKALARRFQGPVKPAAAFVVSKLPHPEALVAVDAVAVAGSSPREVQTGLKFLSGSGAAVGVLHPGARVCVSGQAEKGSDLREVTRRTLQSLRATLKHLELNDSHIVQIKAFITPMASAAEVEKEVVKFYGNQPAPPLVLVEWRSDLPIEIELIASAGKTRPDGEVIEYLTPPGMQPSPVFSRVVRINRGGTIYVSGLYARKGKSGAEQVEEVFGELGRLLEKTGSDFKHLAKATYYVSDDAASRKLNELRPRWYDPRRPPAASKALVAGVGRTGKTITLDMIAVPAGGK